MLVAAGAGTGSGLLAVACARSWRAEHPAQQNTSGAPSLAVRLTGDGAGSPQWAHLGMSAVAMTVIRKV